MAFNGTKNFKKSEIVDYLESVGTKFGAHLNAYTSFDETVYMLEIPADKAGLLDRMKNSLLIIIPLIFSSLDRIEMVSNAMDLRGFGKSGTRTWYTSPRLGRADHIALTVSTAVLLGTIAVSVLVNHSRFYNPFL